MENSNGVATTQKVEEKTLADSVLARVNVFAKSGSLNLPSNYSPANALKFAWLMLSQTVDKDKNPVLQSCKKESIANALLEMCIQGLNPMKKQCYFIAYGGKLEMQRSYQGSIAVAKRVAPVVSVNAQVIYENDVFEYGVDNSTGTKKVIKHEQKMENIDLNKIKGAYAIALFSDGTSNMEVMNILQIKKAWMQGKGGGNTGAHQNFTDEMCKKTIINRVCKGIINNSDDGALFTGDEPEYIPNDTEAVVIEEIKENANLSELQIEASEEVPAVNAHQLEPASVEPTRPSANGKAKQTAASF